MKTHDNRLNKTVADGLEKGDDREDILRPTVGSLARLLCAFEHVHDEVVAGLLACRKPRPSRLRANHIVCRLDLFGEVLGDGVG